MFTNPLRVQLGEGRSREWRLTHPLTYRQGTERHIGIPAGFRTDFASIPQWFLSFFPRDCATARAAVLHDYLYREEGWDRRVSDAIFRRALLDDGVGRWTAFFMWLGVRVGGWRSFKRLNPKEQS